MNSGANVFCPLGTGSKLNIHNTVRGRSGRLLSVLCPFNLRTGCEKIFLAFSRAANVFAWNRLYLYIVEHAPSYLFSMVPVWLLSDRTLKKDCIIYDILEKINV